MDRESFERIVELMDRYSIKPLLGIIPDNKDPMVAKEAADPQFWEKMLLLEKRGYKILERNKHYSRFCEIDIIAQYKNTVVFAEVKIPYVTDSENTYELFKLYPNSNWTEIKDSYKYFM